VLKKGSYVENIYMHQLDRPYTISKINNVNKHNYYPTLNTKTKSCFTFYK